MTKNVLLIGLAFAATFGLGLWIGISWAGSESQPQEVSTEERRGDRERGDRERRSPEAMRNYMINSLELTDEQQEPFFELIVDNRQNMNRVMQEYRRKMYAETDSITTHFEAELRTILSEDQFERFSDRYSVRAFREVRRQQQQRGSGQGRN